MVDGGQRQNSVRVWTWRRVSFWKMWSRGEEQGTRRKPKIEAWRMCRDKGKGGEIGSWERRAESTKRRKGILFWEFGLFQNWVE